MKSAYIRYAHGIKLKEKQPLFIKVLTALTLFILMAALCSLITAKADDDLIATIYTDEYINTENAIIIANAPYDTAKENKAETIYSNPYTNLITVLTDKEIELLKSITWAEANNQSLDGQRAVMEVVFNRVLSSDYPNTVYDVLSQRGQFATWKYVNKVEPTEIQADALQLVLEEPSVLETELKKWQAKGVLPKSLKATDFVYFDTTGCNGKYHMRIGGHWFGTR